MLFKCESCGISFEGKSPKHIYRFCSHACYAKTLCGAKPERRKDRVDRSGYWYIKLPEHPFAGKQGYVAEHRLVMEKKIGRYLKKEETIHHINGIITDNRIENLQLFSSHGQHTKLAHPEIYENQKIIFKGKHFSPITEFKNKA